MDAESVGRGSAAQDGLGPRTLLLLGAEFDQELPDLLGTGIGVRMQLESSVRVVEEAPAEDHCCPPLLRWQARNVAFADAALVVHPAPQREHQVDGRILLDVVVRQRAAVLELLAREDEPLLVGRDALLVLDSVLRCRVSSSSQKDAAIHTFKSSTVSLEVTDKQIFLPVSVWTKMP